MPINSTHPAYDANIDRWQRCRDAYEGGDAVKEAGEKYLPKLGGQDGREYNAYKLRALYYEAMGRTVDGFVGAIARKPTVINASAKLQPIIDDITADGIDAMEFIKALSSEVMIQGRCGVLVDYDETSQRPYLTIYRAEAIINWSANRIVLSESVFLPTSEDQYKQVEARQIRELLLDDAGYVVNVWQEKQGSVGAAEWTISKTLTPTKRGARLDRIPFFWLSTRGQSAAIEKPPLLGLVDVSLSHYRSSADLEHGRHFTGLPTLWVSGVDNNEPILIGSATVLKVPDPSGRVEYAEFKGTGLGSLERALESKEHMMAVLGAAVFASQRKGVEAAETARIRTSGETSLLMGVVSAVESVFTAALQCAAEWFDLSDKIEVQINRDFVDVMLAPQQLQALLQTFQAGAITIDTFLYNLQQAEMLPPDRSIEDEAEAVKNAKPRPESDGVSGGNAPPEDDNG